jgi:hypothetical protein
MVTTSYPPTGGWDFENQQVNYINYFREETKKPFTLTGFLENKKRVTEAWHEPFKYALLQWFRAMQKNRGVFSYFWERTVDFIVRTWLTVDWRWVFKRWVQELYAKIEAGV